MSGDNKSEQEVFTYSLKDNISSMDDLIDQLMLKLDSLGFNEDKSYNYIVGVSELYDNAMRENNKRGIEKPDEIRLFYVKGRLTLAIQNQGYFNPDEKARKSMINEDGSVHIGDHGRGIFIATQFSNGLLFNNSQEEDITEVYISLDK